MTTMTDGMTGIGNCQAELTDDRLVLSTGVLSCTFRWNEGHLVGERLENGLDGAAWELRGDTPDCEFPDQIVEPADGSVEAVERPATAIVPAHLAVVVRTRLGELQVKRIFRLYPNCPMIGCELHLRGKANGTWQVQGVHAGALANIENSAAARQGQVQPTILHRIWAPHCHLDIECVQFFDVTDRRNNLVLSHRAEPYAQPLQLPGNVLFCRDRFVDRGMVLLKEAPCSDMQLASPNCDFVCRRNEIQLVGSGLTPADLHDEEWTRGYGFALGTTKRDEFAILSALRDYQARLRIHKPERDDMILLNTWGDRSEDSRMSEDFVCAEIHAGARLGVTHCQLDHGWETTRSADNAGPPDLSRIWETPRYWDVHPARFPNGLAPCVEAARETGVELCLWFNPSTDDSYAHWRDDAEVLIRLFRQHGIRTFKIDGVQLPDKQAEINLRQMLDAVMAAAGGEAVFNLDVTAGRRFGYHYFSEYGNKFLENRYTDWGNYYPHWTLRNLWMLARCVPPQSLQIEFLNTWRNPHEYPLDDPLAPHRIPFDYCFAITMMAQPLAWFDATSLPSEAFEIAALIRTYRQHQQAIHAGHIFPVGEEPNGTGWTGFQSCRQDNGGYLLVLRELNDRPTARLRCWGLADTNLQFRHVAGHGADFEAAADPVSRIEFALPKPFTFALYEYMEE